MPKTVATLTEELIIANIEGDRLKSANPTVCAVAKNERPAGDLAASAEAVHDLKKKKKKKKKMCQELTWVSCGMKHCLSSDCLDL